MNPREWRHFFKLRGMVTDSNVPHPQMLEIARPLMSDFAKKFPALFGDLADGEKEEAVN